MRVSFIKDYLEELIYLYLLLYLLLLCSSLIVYMIYYVIYILHLHFNINLLNNKQMKHLKTYAIVALLLIALTLESCASRCKQQRRYWSTHRAV